MFTIRRHSQRPCFDVTRRMFSSTGTSLALPELPAHTPYNIKHDDLIPTKDSKPIDMPVKTFRRRHLPIDTKERDERFKHWGQFMQKTEFEALGEWEDLDAFKGLPKPKKQFGNEACEIVWPYMVLMENCIRIHPFTKSIYVYYPKDSLSKEGEKAIRIAQRFSRECLIPITFHNSQCYVETEMLLEHGDTPWIVVHCLDGSSETLPVVCDKKYCGGDESNAVNSKTELLKKVLSIAEKLGSSVKDPRACTQSLNERPNQNHYVRVDYQWLGKTKEDRLRHVVQWSTAEEMKSGKIRSREARALTFLNWDGGLPPNADFAKAVKTEDARLVRGRASGVVQQFFNSTTRVHSTHSRFGNPRMEGRGSK